MINVEVGKKYWFYKCPELLQGTVTKLNPNPSICEFSADNGVVIERASIRNIYNVASEALDSIQTDLELLNNSKRLASMDQYSESLLHNANKFLK